MINKKKLGYRISNLMVSSGKKQCEIAKDIGIGESSISQWINGHWIPSLEFMYKLAKYFGTTVDALLDGCVE